MQCPICFSELGIWTDDPILTIPSLSSPQYEGTTYINSIHITELQNNRNTIEAQLGLSLTSWTVINNINIFQVIKQCVLELRTSTEAILNKQGISKYTYFNYDKNGNYMGTTQTDWNDIDLTGKYIKAIHIEDLRHEALRVEAPAILIVHCHNPEGKEINSIVHDYWCDIYDGETFFAHGAKNAAEHNYPRPISAGAHNINVRFNGMTLEQNITLTPGETRILTFTFTRTEITDLFSRSTSGFNSEEITVPAGGGNIYTYTPPLFGNIAAGVASSAGAAWGVPVGKTAIIQLDLSVEGVMTDTSTYFHIMSIVKAICDVPVLQSLEACLSTYLYEGAYNGLSMFSCSIPIESFDAWFLQPGGWDGHLITSGGDYYSLSGGAAWGMILTATNNYVYLTRRVNYGMLNEHKIEDSNKITIDISTSISHLKRYFSNVPYDIVGDAV